MIIQNIKKALLLLSTVMLCSLAAQASDLDLATKPLAVETEGIPPNIMLILDESGSMSNSGSYDMFYSPGFDGSKEYACSNTSNILQPLAGNTVIAYVSRASSTRGLPYFNYNGTFYTWGGNTKTSIDGNSITGGNVCFDPDVSYEVKLQANQIACPAGEVKYYVPSGWFGGSWYYNKDSCPSNASRCECQVPSTALAADSRAKTETLSGSYLNWYFSATEAEWADTSLTGGYKDYGVNGNNRGYWTEDYADDFNTSGDDQGLKKEVSYRHQRLAVAKDVIKMLVRNLDNANLALMGFTSRNVSGYPERLPLRHGFYDFSQDENQAVKNQKEQLLNIIHNVEAEGGTPTGKSLLAAMRYLFTGYHSERFHFDGSATANKRISDFFGSYSVDTNWSTPSYSSTKKLITAENYCQKNAFVVLTDGEPSVDGISSMLTSYVPEGVDRNEFNALSNSSSGNINSLPIHKKSLIRIAGALADHDFLPNLAKEEKKLSGQKTNVETFMIGFGDEGVLNSREFIMAGQAGAGKGAGEKGNFYAANDGAAISQAFDDIFTRIQAASASVTAIAVSAVSELRTDNFAIQATYQTSHWSSELKAYRLNKKGQFINPDDSLDDENAGSDSSSNITPIWEANSVLNNKYVIGTNKVPVNRRKVFTWDGSKGVRFGSDTMTRPANKTASLAEFNVLPKNMRDDLQRRAGSDAQEQYDLMMYLLGDVKHEVGNLKLPGSGKYRARGTYDVDNNGVVTSVISGGFLGDIASSSPMYVKEPSRPWNDKVYGTLSKPYSDFKEAHKDRAAMVYTGTNRGFLHGIAVEGSDAGEEVFAYMPNALSSITLDEGYHYLANRDYQHRFYVDLTPTVSDVFMDFYSETVTESSPEWRTVLVGGLRAGGKGYFALDITCPKKTNNGSTCDDESFNANNVLWEFTSEDDDDLGYSFAEPIIARVFYDRGEQESGRHGQGRGRWAAIISNGYNSRNGKAALFILFLDGGLDGTWTENVDYIKLYAESADSNDNAKNKNGLSSATAIDLDGDGVIDHIYAGDLKGQMWNFDVSQSVVYQSAEEATP